jgi:hypothetical protein
MRSNVKSKSSSSTDLPRSAETTSSRPKAPEPPLAPATGTDDWSDPSKQRQMSAIWPLLWIVIPLGSLILYGLLTGH